MLADAEARELFKIFAAYTFQRISDGTIQMLERYPMGAATILDWGHAFPAPSDGREIYGLVYVRLSESKDDIEQVGAKLGAGIFDL
jgi:hypothetical protein